jgi:DnaJ-class molecular chaperone
VSLYDDLGVARDADAKEIRRAYRKAASRHHPDRPGGDVRRFQAIQRAYDTLSDKERRSRYDLFGEEARVPNLRAHAMQTLCDLFSAAIANENIEADAAAPRGQIPPKVREMLDKLYANYLRRSRP